MRGVDLMKSQVGVSQPRQAQSGPQSARHGIPASVTPRTLTELGANWYPRSLCPAGSGICNQICEVQVTLLASVRRQTNIHSTPTSTT